MEKYGKIGIEDDNRSHYKAVNTQLHMDFHGFNDFISCRNVYFFKVCVMVGKEYDCLNQIKISFTLAKDFLHTCSFL